MIGAVLLDVLWFACAGIGGTDAGTTWSHGRFMALVWSGAAAVLALRILRSFGAGVVVGMVVFSHWVLDFICHPIPFPSFSWRTWQWSFGHPLPSDLPLLFAGSPKVGLGLYNSISAVQATALELGMFILGAAVHVAYLARKRRTRESHSANQRNRSIVSH
jgi:hypothetical protein